MLGLLLAAAISIRVNPQAASAPATLAVTAKITPSAENRALIFFVGGEDFETSHAIQLDGAEAPKTIRFVFSGVPCGVYNVGAVLKTADGKEQLALAPVHVAGFACDSPPSK